MTLNLERTSGLYHLTATNESGNQVMTDGSEGIGGEGKGMRPMEMLLASLAGCSTIDVVLILKRQRQDLQDIKIKVEAEKEKVESHSVFKTIHLHFDLYGEVKEKKAEQAISLSMEKYCSVAMALNKTSTITSSFSIHPAHV
ncbi:MAG: OsmC family protein [Saprospiraceae bacterium]|nr:OsmC family protein [Saprospiraceae bacterium]